VQTKVTPNPKIRKEGSPANRLKNTQNLNLPLKRQYNKENELIFMIYDLRLVILEILRVFRALLKKKMLFFGWAVEWFGCLAGEPFLLKASGENLGTCF
jgi:hypothetical protein